MSVVAIVVTYNRLSLLKQCIEHLLKQSAPCDILLVDNASSDGTEEWAKAIAKTNRQLIYRNTGENLGGAGGFHAGIKWAAELGYTYLWLMDDDCLPEPDALQKLMEADRLLGGAEQYGFLSSTVLWIDGQECKMNRQKIRKAYYERVELLKHGLIQVEQATFVSLFLPVATVWKVGLPIRDFFIWGDDIEYTRRIAVRQKILCYMVGQSQVVHAMKENSGSSIAEDEPKRIARYSYAFRNENYLYRQEGVKGFAYYTAKCALNALRTITKAKDYRMARLWVIIRQYLGGLFFNPKIEYIKDKEIKTNEI